MEFIWKFGSKNAAFLTRRFLHLHFHLKSNGMIFFSYYLAHQKGLPA